MTAPSPRESLHQLAYGYILTVLLMLIFIFFNSLVFKGTIDLSFFHKSLFTIVFCCLTPFLTIGHSWWHTIPVAAVCVILIYRTLKRIPLKYMKYVFTLFWGVWIIYGVFCARSMM